MHRVQTQGDGEGPCELWGSGRAYGCLSTRTPAFSYLGTQCLLNCVHTKKCQGHQYLHHTNLKVSSKGYQLFMGTFWSPGADGRGRAWKCSHFILTISDLRSLSQPLRHSEGKGEIHLLTQEYHYGAPRQNLMSATLQVKDPIALHCAYNL